MEGPSPAQASVASHRQHGVVSKALQARRSLFTATPSLLLPLCLLVCKRPCQAANLSLCHQCPCKVASQHHQCPCKVASQHHQCPCQVASHYRQAVLQARKQGCSRGAAGTWPRLQRGCWQAR